MASQATEKKFAFSTAFTIFFLRLILIIAAHGLFRLVRTINSQMAHRSKAYSTWCQITPRRCCPALLKEPLMGEVWHQDETGCLDVCN
jgi:hypothetical protein